MTTTACAYCGHDLPGNDPGTPVSVRAPGSVAFTGQVLACDDCLNWILRVHVRRSALRAYDPTTRNRIRMHLDPP